MPMKPPHAGKSRLRGAAGTPPGADGHAELVLALAVDTLTAAIGAAGVRRVLVVGSEPATLTELNGLGVEVVVEQGAGGLNAALSHGAALLRGDDPDSVVAALQADLPALRSVELAEALAEADERRAFVADRHGTGTTLLVSAPGGPLGPLFGTDSARSHLESGAVALTLAAATLRSDVDTPDDLVHARALGLGCRTTELVGTPCCVT
ncbi:2-phospho-L-lactate guanylyltransferase [Amycolatopsis marina]|uniref:2-phospho-L-lactate guanylyltransferase n=2 Tax=Amycolatopsis marina TaxID=490629 RepID=A0A1I0YJ74_9PSEU|nr:2-phospho-L-lactate guanylyltransferase [Amycolatopsis marina]